MTQDYVHVIGRHDSDLVVGLEPARAYSQIVTRLSVVEFVDVLASLAQDTIYDRNSGFITFQNRLTPRIPDKDVRKHFRDW